MAANETLWTGFNNQKIFAERARKDEKGRDIASAIDRQYVSAASVSGDQLTLTVSNSGTPGTDTTVQFSGQQNTIEHIYGGEVAPGKEFAPDASKNVVIPVAYVDPQTSDVYGGLISAVDKEKLDSVEQDAEENVIEEVQVNGSALTPVNKAVNVEIPVLGVQRNGADLTPDSTTKKVNVEVPVLGVKIENDANPLTPDSSKFVTIPLAQASTSGAGGNSGAITPSALEDLEYLAAAAPTGASANNPLITQTDLQTAIADFGGFDEVNGTGTDNHPDVANPSTKIIYLVEDSSATGDDKFKEWIYDATNSSWKLIGDTTMSMVGYAKIPSGANAGDIVAFSSTDDLADTGYTVAQLQNKVETISVGTGSTISPTTGTTNINIPNATTGADGAMSSTDKSKLDGIESGAEVNIIEGISLNGSALTPDPTTRVVDITVSVPSASSTTPSMDGTGAAGSSTDYARADHVHPSDTAKADKVSNATDGNLAALDSNGNLTDSGKSASDFITGVQLAGAQAPLQPASGVVTIPNAVSTGTQGATNGLMTANQSQMLDQIGAWTMSYATFSDSGEGTESTAQFPFTVS